MYGESKHFLDAQHADDENMTWKQKKQGIWDREGGLRLDMWQKFTENYTRHVVFSGPKKYHLLVLRVWPSFSPGCRCACVSAKELPVVGEKGAEGWLRFGEAVQPLLPLAVTSDFATLCRPFPTNSQDRVQSYKTCVYIWATDTSACAFSSYAVVAVGFHVDRSSRTRARFDGPCRK